MNKLQMEIDSFFEGDKKRFTSSILTKNYLSKIAKMYSELPLVVHREILPPTGTSRYEWRLMFRDTLMDATNEIFEHHKKGRLNTIIVGGEADKIIQFQPGYRFLEYDERETGYIPTGFLDNIVICRSMNDTDIPRNGAILGYLGHSDDTDDSLKDRIVRLVLM